MATTWPITEPPENGEDAPRWQGLLNATTPKSRLLITNSGGLVNMADIERERERNDIAYQTLNQGGAELSLVAQGINQDVYYVAVDLPAGRELTTWFRTVKLTEGAYLVDEVTVDGYTGGTPGFKDTVNGPVPDGVQTQLLAGVMVTGAPVVKVTNFIETGVGMGPARPAGGGDSEGIIYRRREPRLLRITRLNGAAYTLALRLICTEREI